MLHTVRSGSESIRNCWKLIHNLSMGALNVISYICLFCLTSLITSYSASLTSKYLQFSSQKESPLEKASNHAILKSPAAVSLKSFTICSSIYVRFFRGYQTFYTLRRNTTDSLWFSLSVYNQDILKELYTVRITHLSGSVYSKTGQELKLRPHEWSHACSTIDVESGHILVVVNGITVFDTILNSNTFTDNLPTVFQNKLILGLSQEVFSELK